MNIYQMLQNYSPAFIKIHNWQNNRWLLWDEKTKLWNIYEEIKGNNFGKIVGETSDENLAIEILTFETQKG